MTYDTIDNVVCACYNHGMDMDHTISDNGDFFIHLRKTGPEMVGSTGFEQYVKLHPAAREVTQIFPDGEIRNYFHGTMNHGN